MMGNQFIWIFCLSIFLEISYSHDCNTETRCKITSIRRRKTADCYDRNFKTFPKCVPSDVEVLELSFNRIREVSKSDISRYRYLTILYLTDNLLTKLDDELFEDLGSLSTLDLSLNAISKVPLSLFQLPSLNKLYLSQNKNINIIDAVEEAKPIKSPFTFLDISLTTDEDNLMEFPDFGPMPMLLTLNITGNTYVIMSPKHFAGLCNLERLINNNVTTEYIYVCDCWRINNWLKMRNVQFTPFRCSVDENTCSDLDPGKEEKILYNQCHELASQLVMQRRIWKIGIGVGVTLLLLIILAFAYCLWIRKKHLKEKSQKLGKQPTSPTQDGMHLLNNQTKTFPI